ncbi:hypothetical protein [Methylobacterium sp. ARG-1]|uniref:hypothetical protein n=1 Tax=Methylobacterium sp. ARG-1 TaxID=1692501 RepID=UPI00191104B2|nr:hypothetical protein [Methylobacterium sp. ARG-1]
MLELPAVDCPDIDLKEAGKVRVSRAVLQQLLSLAREQRLVERRSTPATRLVGAALIIVAADAFRPVSGGPYLVRRQWTRLRFPSGTGALSAAGHLITLNSNIQRDGASIAQARMRPQDW